MEIEIIALVAACIFSGYRLSIPVIRTLKSLGVIQDY